MCRRQDELIAAHHHRKTVLQLRRVQLYGGQARRYIRCCDGDTSVGDMSGHGVSENTCAEKRNTDPNKIDTSRVGDEKWRYGTDTSDGDGRLETGEASQVG